MAIRQNMGGADRSIRAIIAAIIAVLYFTGVIDETLGLVLLIVATIFLLTSLMSFCPIYYPFNLTTKHQDKKK